jgi:hypothetical protein
LCGSGSAIRERPLCARRRGHRGWSTRGGRALVRRCASRPTTCCCTSTTSTSRTSSSCIRKRCRRASMHSHR